ncbi:hypothetical protein MASR2M17_01520 [Aminivibrio sp.]
MVLHHGDPHKSLGSGKQRVCVPSWTPEKGKTPESFALDLVMFYTLEFFKRTGEPRAVTALLRYDNLSVSFR